MHIRLVNFRCYDDTSFDFGEEGLALLSGASGKGKCLGRNSKVLMYDCSIKNIQDIEVDDLVMGDDSLPRRVLNTTSGRDMMYEIIPQSGESYIVNSDHILTLRHVCPKIKYKKCKKLPWYVYYYIMGKKYSKGFFTKEEAIIFKNSHAPVPYDISIQEYIRLPKSFQKLNYTYHMGFDLGEKDLEYDPYFLGVWLGNSKSCNVEIRTSNKEIIDYLEVFCEKHKFTLEHEMDYCYLIHDRNKNRLNKYLKKHNLLNNKHIPNIHKSSSREQRLSLLAGLIDSIGHVQYNSINILEKSRTLAEDIKFLALSLGFMAVVCKKYKKSVSEECCYYNICIYGSGIEIIPTILSKKTVYKNEKKAATLHRFKIVQRGEDDYFGFELDGNGRFLLGDCKVTHNSSVLMGIYFALYGSGTKVTAYGKTSCSVELSFDGLKILRTKRPNRLLVNDIYEDASGQEIINKKFGDTFNVTGYISQNALNSFVLMSPIDKLAFLEKFAFRDVDLGKIKGRCKAYISKQHDELLGITSQLDMSRKILDEMTIPNDIQFPLKCKISQREIAIKNEYTRFKNCTILIKRAEKNKKEAEDELNDLRVFEATLQSRNEQYSEETEKLKILQLEIDGDVYEGDDNLEDYQNRLERCLSKRKLNILEEKLVDNSNKLEEMKNKEKMELSHQLNSIRESLWQEYSKDEINTNILELKACLLDMEKVDEYRKEVKRCTIDIDKYERHKMELEKFILLLEEKQVIVDKLISQQELYSCPSCLSKVRLVNEKLLLADDIEDVCTVSDIDTIKEEIKELKNNISKLQRLIPTEEDKLLRKQEAEKEINSIISSYDDIPNSSEIKEDIEYLLQYQSSQFELEKKRKELEMNINQEIFSLSYKSFKESVESLKNEVVLLQKKNIDYDEVMNEEHLRNKIVEQNNAKSRLLELEKTRTDIEKSRTKCKSIIDKVSVEYIEKYGKIRCKEELVKKIIEQDGIIEEQNKKCEYHKNNIQLIENWKKYQDELNKYHSWKERVKELEREEKRVRSEYAAATELKDKIIEAESIAMLNIIDTINTHARIYLDTFFTENPISVQLQPFKETKNNTKPSINIVIEYKGMEADMNMLSGGELSRVILAYTLALAEMFNTPLLLLDECTASLDQDLTNIVFDCIRENFNGKMTLIIAHQIVRGTFDKVIELK